MTSSSDWPAEWRHPRKPLWAVTMVVLGVLAAAALALGVADLVSGETGRAGLLLLGAPLLLTALVLVYAIKARRGTSHIQLGKVDAGRGRGVLIRYSALVTAGYLAALATGLVFFGVLAIGGIATVVDEGSDMLVPAVLSVVVCGYLLGGGLDIALGRLARGVLVLTPEGIYHRSWAMHAYLPWQEVAFVGAS